MTSCCYFSHVRLSLDFGFEGLIEDIIIVTRMRGTWPRVSLQNESAAVFTDFLLRSSSLVMRWDGKELSGRCGLSIVGEICDYLARHRGGSARGKMAGSLQDGSRESFQ